jgi:hypothetical protein
MISLPESCGSQFSRDKYIQSLGFNRPNLSIEASESDDYAWIPDMDVIFLKQTPCIYQLCAASIGE